MPAVHAFNHPPFSSQPTLSSPCGRARVPESNTHRPAGPSIHCRTVRFRASRRAQTRYHGLFVLSSRNCAPGSHSFTAPDPNPLPSVVLRKQARRYPPHPPPPHPPRDQRLPTRKLGLSATRPRRLGTRLLRHRDASEIGKPPAAKPKKGKGKAATMNTYANTMNDYKHSERTGGHALSHRPNAGASTSRASGGRFAPPVQNPHQHEPWEQISDEHRSEVNDCVSRAARARARAQKGGEPPGR